VPRVKRQKGHLNTKAFVRAIINGAILAEAAQLAGSRAVTQEALHTVGERFSRRPAVRALLQDVAPVLELGWAGFVQWSADVARGKHDGKVTDQDRIALGFGIGRAMGKYANININVNVKAKVEIRGLKRRMVASTSAASPVPALPSSVQHSTLPVIEAKVEVPK
jgi:hypothetical protein